MHHTGWDAVSSGVHECVCMCLLANCRSDCVFRCWTLFAGLHEWFSDSMCLLRWTRTLQLGAACVLVSPVIHKMWYTCDPKQFFGCFLIAWLSLCLSVDLVCGSSCVCPEDRAVTGVNGAVSVRNVIPTVSLAETKHEHAVAEIKLDLFYCL